MRWLVIKFIAIISVMGFLQGIVGSWIVSSDWLSVWAIVLAVNCGLILWYFAFEYMFNQIDQFFKDKDNASTEQSTD